jgi:5'-phosphate synthase pdxT subunit
MIVIARELTDSYPTPLNLLDIGVSRNYFGRQVDSFEAEIDIEGIDGEAMRAVFIRAPVVSDVGDGVVKIASLDDGQAVAVKKGRVLASSFHPELTTDTRMHSLFVELAREGQIDTLNPTRNAEEISNTA